MIDIKGLDKALVLKALYDNSVVQGLGFLQARTSVTLEDHKAEIERLSATGAHLYFDYYHGRVMKVNITGDRFDPYLYDRDLGTGAAADAIDSIR